MNLATSRERHRAIVASSWMKKRDSLWGSDSVCIIIDTNLSAKVFRSPVHVDFLPIIQWLFDKEGCLIYGGHLAKELEEVRHVGRALRVLIQAGKAVRVSDEKVNDEEKIVTQTGFCCSNDHHVIALARVSGARTLCSLDQDLQKDFRNHRLITNPRGSVYQRAEHSRLLRHTSSCGRRIDSRKRR